MSKEDPGLPDSKADQSSRNDQSEKEAGGIGVAESGQDVLDDGDAMEGLAEASPEVRLKRIQASPASSSKIVAEPDSDELPEMPFQQNDGIDTQQLSPVPLPAVQDVPALPIVLSARPVERHLLNHQQINQTETLPQHTSVADASHLALPQLRPGEQVAIENPRLQDEPQPAPQQDDAAGDWDVRSGKNDDSLPANEVSEEDAFTKATCFDAPVKEPLLRASIAIDPSADNGNHNRAWFADQKKPRTQILRLNATTPADPNASGRTTASFDMNAPAIIRRYHPGALPNKKVVESEEFHQAVRSILNAKTQKKTIGR